MKLLTVFLITELIQLGSTLAIKNLIFDKIAQKVSRGIFGEKEETPKKQISDISELLNRTEDVCSFTKIEVIQEELPDPEACIKLNERFKKNDNYEFINEFGEIFNSLKEGIDSLKFPSTKGKMKSIFFIGNTGAGKSTLVQILGADNSRIYSKPVSESSADFIIVDFSKIGEDTVMSQTLYPDLIFDSEKGYVLCDNPGFRDTRSPIHEIIATYSMRKVLQNSEKIKIVIVSNQASLQVGGYRDDFTNLLKHLTDFFYNINKYKESIYLIGTKVENKIKMEKGQPKIVSDESIINSTAHFLRTVKDSLNNQSYKSSNKVLFFKNSIEIIESLLEQKDDTYNRIKIVRKPAEEGPISENPVIQSEKNAIRQMLLNDENMVEVNDSDIGFALTDSAVKYLNDIYKKMNLYVTKLSQIIGEYFKNYYENLIDSETDMTNLIGLLKKMRTNVKYLSNEIGLTKNPGQYVNLITNFSVKNKLQLDCLTTFKNISTLNDYLINLEDLSEANKYSPLSWNVSMKLITDFVENKSEQINLLYELFKIMSTQKFQKKGLSIFEESENLIVTYDNYLNFLEKTYLKSRYALVDVDDTLLNKINAIINTTLKHKLNFTCSNDILTIRDYFIVLSEIEDSVFEESCDNATTVVFLAMHTLFIDRNLNTDFFKGKSVIFIAPIWEVIGTITIGVDGKSGGNKMPQAENGVIGKYGENGLPGGSFVGIGSKFINGNNLIINASGGKGQDGQDGGDGIDGALGSIGLRENLVHVSSNPRIYIIVNFKEDVSVAEGSRGEAGSDAGGGGRGGHGGLKGTAKIFNIGNEPHFINIFAYDGSKGHDGKDGKPGKGGVKGCDLKETQISTNIIGITISSSKDTEFINCNAVNPNGNVRKSNVLPQYNSEEISKTDHPVCLHIMNFQKSYLAEYHSLLSDGITKEFIYEMNLTKY